MDKCGQTVDTYNTLLYIIAKLYMHMVYNIHLVNALNDWLRYLCEFKGRWNEVKDGRTAQASDSQSYTIRFSYNSILAPDEDDDSQRKFLLLIIIVKLQVVRIAISIQKNDDCTECS